MYKMLGEWKLFTGIPLMRVVWALPPCRICFKGNARKEGTMKKRIWSLLLCLVLVFAGFAGCGSKDDAANAAPEEMVKVKLREFADKVSDALSKSSANAFSFENTGCDITLDLSLEEQIAAGYGLTGLSSLGLKANVDVKDSVCFHAAGSLLLNGEDVIAADILTDEENIYLNLPAYAEQYMGMSYKDILGKSMEDFAQELAKEKEGMPSAKDLLEMWNGFSDKFIDSFTYQGMEKKQSIGTGDYKISGDKYITNAKSEEIDKAFTMLMEELKKFPKLDVQKISPISAEVDEFNVNYYVGKKGEYAWEIEGIQGEEESSVVFVSTKKGFCLYVIDLKGKEETVLYSEKESDKKGKVMICSADEEIVINYDNLTENSIDLSTTFEGMVLKFKLRSEDEHISADFDVNMLGIIVAGKLESTEKELKLDASVSMSGLKMGTLTFNAKARDFASFTVPSTYLDAEEWNASFDQEKLMGDLSQLMMKFPFLMDMMQ